MNAIASIPRCGSTWVFRSLAGLPQAGWTPEPHEQYGVVKTHRVPQEEPRLALCTRAVFLFGDVVRAVASTHRMRMDAKHFANCGAKWPPVRHIFDADVLGYGRMFEHWSDPPLPTLAVRYEALEDGGVRSRVAEWLDAEVAWLPWKRRVTDVNPADTARIEVAYEGLIERVRAAPDVQALGETRIGDAVGFLGVQADAIRAAAARLGWDFTEACRIIRSRSGRVVIAGIGKSGHIARKITATMCATGTPSFFLHGSEALHGDLGALCTGDVCVLVSKSGTGPEVEGVLDRCRHLGVPVIAMSASLDSVLAQGADAWIDCSVLAEACPLDLMPTASTTVTLALGDALAMAVLSAEGTMPAELAALHPGGSLGSQLREAG